jgi:hypothetical protein
MTAPLSVDLAMLKALLDAVVGLPWTLHDTSTVYMNGTAAYFTRHDGKPGQRAHLVCTQDEAELFVAAVNALPALLADHERLGRELDTMTAVAKSNKRHVKAMAEEVERLTAELARQDAGVAETKETDHG